jgi:hypothetical protein
MLLIYSYPALLLVVGNVYSRKLLVLKGTALHMCNRNLCLPLRRGYVGNKQPLIAPNDRPSWSLTPKNLRLIAYTSPLIPSNYVNKFQLSQVHYMPYHVSLSRTCYIFSS